jgi:hypothetical protein
MHLLEFLKTSKRRVSFLLPSATRKTETTNQKRSGGRTKMMKFLLFVGILPSLVLSFVPFIDGGKGIPK